MQSAVFRLTSANKLHNFNLRFGRDFGLRPQRLLDDGAVHLDRYPIGPEAKILQ